MCQYLDESEIDKCISELKVFNFDLTDEGEVDSLLGIKIDTEKDKTMFMTQPALIDTIIKSIGLEDDSKQYQSSASLPLHKHK